MTRPRIQCHQLYDVLAAEYLCEDGAICESPERFIFTVHVSYAEIRYALRDLHMWVCGCEIGEDGDSGHLVP
jgi:hypothetical protein